MPNKLSQFWQELKRRKVIHVIVVYASAAFVILEAVDIIFPRLNFPDWTITFVMILLAVGFPIALIFSWIFDVTPEGIEKTKPIKELKKEEKLMVPSSWRIATFVSIVIILGLIGYNIFGVNRNAEIDKSLAKSIAVLPFNNMSGEDEREFICDGMTDEIISQLYKVRSFDKVVSYSNVSIYKDSEKSIQVIAEELGVNYILESSYKRMGEEIKITPHLIEPGSDNPIWSNDYELPYDEVPRIPGEIALEIANNLNAVISEDVRQSIERMPTDNIEAYELIQQNHYYLHRFDFTISFLDSVKKAIELDPGYADAYADLGHLILTKAYYVTAPGVEKYKIGDALTYLNRALELDPDNIFANMHLANFNLLNKWDYINADKQFVHILEQISSTSELVNSSYLEFLLKMGRLDDALSFASETDRTGSIARIYIKQGLDHEASLRLRKWVEVQGGISFPYVAEIYLWMKEYDTARYYLESAVELNRPEMDSPRFMACMALACRNTNEPGKALEIIDHLKADSDGLAPGSPDYFLGWYHSAIGEIDSAFVWLEKAFENRSPEFPWLKVNPAFNSLKDDPRYQDLYERTGFKRYDDYMASKEK